MTPAAAWRGITGYFGHPDPHLALGGTIALTIATSQPLYPAYVAYAAGAWILPAFATWLSTPFFLAAPAVARRSPDGGRALLLGAAIGNTVVTALALGPASGVEAFYAPCLLLAGVLSTTGRRAKTVMTTAVAAVAGLLVTRAVVPWASLTPRQDHALVTMHGISVAGITLMILVAALRISRSDATRGR